MKLHAPSHSRLLSLLSAALPLDGGRARQLRALHLANRQALLAQQALLYCLLNRQAWAGPYLDESRAALLRSQARLDRLGARRHDLAALLEGYGRLLQAADDEQLRAGALALGGCLLEPCLALSAALARSLGTPRAQWLSLCGRLYAYSQRTLCLLAVDFPDRPEQLQDCHRQCRQALERLRELGAEVSPLLAELGRLQCTPPQQPDGSWLHHVSASLLHGLGRLEA